MANRGPMDKTDQVFFMLKMLTERLGVDRIDVTVRRDGRVEISALTPEGSTVKTARADLMADSSDPYPSVALARMLEGKA